MCWVGNKLRFFKITHDQKFHKFEMHIFSQRDIDELTRMLLHMINTFYIQMTHMLIHMINTFYIQKESLWNYLSNFVCEINLLLKYYIYIYIFKWLASEPFFKRYFSRLIENLSLFLVFSREAFMRSQRPWGSSSPVTSCSQKLKLQHHRLQEESIYNTLKSDFLLWSLLLDEI